MRKADPLGLCEQVQDRLAQLHEFYDDAWAAFNGDQHAAARQSTLGELVFHRAYVELESFLSAYFVACINRNAGTFVDSRRSQIEASVRAKYPGTTVDYVAFEPPNHLTVAAVGGLVDGNEQNLTFGSYAQMVDRAQQWLAPEWAAKIVAVPVSRQRVVDAAKAIRNCIAHQSKASFDSMNAT